MPKLTLRRTELAQLLPHGEPMLLLDRLLLNSATPHLATGLWNVRTEACRGHFPGNLVMPGVLWLEIANQVAGGYLATTRGQAVNGFYVGCDEHHIRLLARPRMIVRVDVEVLAVRSKLLVFSARGYITSSDKEAFASSRQRCANIP